MTQTTNDNQQEHPVDQPSSQSDSAPVWLKLGKHATLYIKDLPKSALPFIYGMAFLDVLAVALVLTAVANKASVLVVVFSFGLCLTFSVLFIFSVLHLAANVRHADQPVDTDTKADNEGVILEP